LTKVAIVGSREFKRLDLVIAYVNALPPDTVVVSGGARGVDRTAEEAAEKRGLTTLIFPAEWDKYGLQAGFLRNRLLVKACDYVCAFYNGTSRGTWDTIQKAKKAGKRVVVVTDTEQSEK
jgi:predicted Rossmann fold nucleotide-binding protein DprA/Smf involved in DNA uptake